MPEHSSGVTVTLLLTDASGNPLETTKPARLLWRLGALEKKMEKEETYRRNEQHLRLRIYALFQHCCTSGGVRLCDRSHRQLVIAIDRRSERHDVILKIGGALSHDCCHSFRLSLFGISEVPLH